MSYIKKKIMLKGEGACVLSIEGDERSRVGVEWLRGKQEGEIFLFSSPQKFVVVGEDGADIPAKNVCAAAIGKKLTTRGQLVPFNWQTAVSGVNMSAYLQEREPLVKKQPPAETVPPEKAPPETALPETAPPEKIPFEEKADIPDVHIQPTQPLESITIEKADKMEEVVCPCAVEPREVRAFSSAFPDAIWLLHEYPSTGGIRRYLTGSIYENGVLKSKAAAVPGSFSLKPPPWLSGFSLYLTDDDGQGYWIAVSPARGQ